MLGNDPEKINEILRVLWRMSLALELHRSDGCPESGICRIRRFTMTSNAEEHANPPAAATVQPPKATKRANVAARKRRIAPAKPRSGKKASSAERRPKGQRLPNR